MTDERGSYEGSQNRRSEGERLVLGYGESRRGCFTLAHYRCVLVACLRLRPIVPFSDCLMYASGYIDLCATTACGRGHACVDREATLNSRYSGGLPYGRQRDRRPKR